MLQNWRVIMYFAMKFVFSIILYYFLFFFSLLCLKINIIGTLMNFSKTSEIKANLVVKPGNLWKNSTPHPGRSIPAPTARRSCFATPAYALYSRKRGGLGDGWEGVAAQHRLLGVGRGNEASEGENGERQTKVLYGTSFGRPGSRAVGNFPAGLSIFSPGRARSEPQRN